MKLSGKVNDTFCLIGGLCTNCGTYSFPRKPLCSRCYHEQVEEVFLSSVGTVYSYTHVRVRPPEGFPLPYAIGYVLLNQEQIVVPALLTGSETDLAALAIGQPVVLAENTAEHQADYVFVVKSNELKAQEVDGK